MTFQKLHLNSVWLLCVALMAWQCVASKQGATPKDPLALLLSHMTGDFSSQAQSLQDSDYFDIRLHIRPIWLADKANHWLYVEQATAQTPEKPYRQRVYKVERDGETGFKSIVYTIDEPTKWVGAFKTPTVLDQYKPTNLLLRECCAYCTSNNRCHRRRSNCNFRRSRSLCASIRRNHRQKSESKRSNCNSSDFLS